jgi:hypothetical protein
MEGVHRPLRRWGIAVGVAVSLLGTVSVGCGSDSQAVETRDPEATFAPVVELDPEERWYPMGARWFLDRSVLEFATDHGCGDFEVAVGRTLEEKQNEVTQFIVVGWLGKYRPGYERYPTDARCEIDGSRDFFSVEHTRPFGKEDRPRGLPRTEGWYIDLVNKARPGRQGTEEDGGRELLENVPAYVERVPDEVDGDDGVRLTYWLLYGMNEPRAGDGVDRRDRHEGDWERLDVLLREDGGDDSYEPVRVQLYVDGRPGREVPWDALSRVGGEGTHPVLSAARGSHELSAGQPAGGCPECPRWLLWKQLKDLRSQFWYGFGGAWGEVGRDSATTGPLGPHGEWPKGKQLYPDS